MSKSFPRIATLIVLCGTAVLADDTETKQRRVEQSKFTAIDVFGLEYASDPQIAPDGESIIYVRNFMDIMKDKSRSSLWSVQFDGSQHRPVTVGNGQESQPRWSPDGKRLAYIGTDDGTAQLYLRWIDTGQTARLTQLTQSPSSMTWSPDGRWIAFSMFVPRKSESFAEMPEKPKDAEWAEPPKVVRKLTYRFDGRGYLDDGYDQLFVISSEGGTPRQLTFGDFHHDGAPAWSADSQSLVFSANRAQDWEYDPVESDLYELRLADGSLKKLTDRKGPDVDPSISPDGSQIAYIGFDDRQRGYHTTSLSLMNRDGSGKRVLSEGFDYSIESPTFAADGRGIYFYYDDQGVTKIGYATLQGEIHTVATHLGGLSLGRPYSAGSYSVSSQGRVAYTHTQVDHPADVAVADAGAATGRRLTRLNDDLFAHKELAVAEELWIESSFDGRKIHAWLLKPPGFEPGKKYPLLLEIHGGPFANYGDRFAAEMQLYASAGYLVLYVNPRGSTSYGDAFANLIHHNYPGEDYDDLMSAVDAVIAEGYVDPEQLFVTGGSGGGVLTAWIVGKTNRFRAAVVAKPVINWFSFALTADAYNFFYKYWFPGLPWDHPEAYFKRSPISLVGNVETPTMLLTGEEDYRTPMSETEQYYQALQLRQVDTMLVRIPGASHSIAARPSRLIAKVAHVLAWFERYRDED